jgi:hypothetical protein
MENQGFYEACADPGHNFIGSDSTDASPLGDFGWTRIAASSLGFNVLQIERLPAGSTILSAKLLMKTQNLVRVTRTVTAEPNGEGTAIIWTDHGVQENNINGVVSVLLFGEDKDGDVHCVGICGNTVATNNTDNWFELDITDLCQTYLSLINGSSAYVNFSILLTPDTVTLGEALYSAKETLIAVRESTWLSASAQFTNSQNSCDTYPYQTESTTKAIRYDGWTLGDLELTFQLPDLSQFEVPYRNMIRCD